MLNVLIIDDDLLVIKCLTEKIDWEYLGYNKPFAAMNGNDGYNIIETNNIDVVICDFKMPIMNGLELSKKIQENNDKIKIILLSAYESFEIAKTSLTLRMFDYLLKPLNQELLETLANDLSMIATEVELSKWISLFFTGEFDNDIINALASGDNAYIDSFFDKLRKTYCVKFSVSIDEMIISKVVDVLYNYLKENLGFPADAVLNNKQKLIKQLSDSKTYNEKIDIVYNKFLVILDKDVKKSDTKDIVEEIIKMIESMYHDKALSITMVAKEFHYSREHINRIFKKETEKSINRYILSVRMKHAKTMLVESEDNISEIAFKVGYDSLSYFTSSFRDYYNMTPTEYRSKNLKIKRNF